VSSNASAIDAGTNIMNAFDVVRRTYENLSKLFQELDVVANKEGLNPITPKFLRWRSESDCKAWATTIFVKLFQSQDAPKHTKVKGLKQGAIYGVEVAFEEGKSPILYLSRYDYDVELVSWSRLPGPGDLRLFHWPRWDQRRFVIGPDTSVLKSIPRNAEVKKKYWGLEMAVFSELPLTSVDSRDKIKSLILSRLKALPNFEREIVAR
jgi:hypothetical protein